MEFDSTEYLHLQSADHPPESDQILRDVSQESASNQNHENSKNAIFINPIHIQDPEKGEEEPIRDLQSQNQEYSNLVTDLSSDIQGKVSIPITDP